MNDIPTTNDQTIIRREHAVPKLTNLPTPVVMHTIRSTSLMCMCWSIAFYFAAKLVILIADGGVSYVEIKQERSYER